MKCDYLFTDVIMYLMKADFCFSLNAKYHVNAFFYLEILCKSERLLFIDVVYITPSRKETKPNFDCVTISVTKIRPLVLGISSVL